VPLYESNPSAVKSEIATFIDNFPNGTIWSNDDNGAGYDILLLGQTDILKINLDELQQRLHRDEPVLRSLAYALIDRNGAKENPAKADFYRKFMGDSSMGTTSKSFGKVRAEWDAS
jgi:hypothetical protein